MFRKSSKEDSLFEVIVGLQTFFFSDNSFFFFYHHQKTKVKRKTKISKISIGQIMLSSKFVLNRVSFKASEAAALTEMFLLLKSDNKHQKRGTQITYLVSHAFYLLMMAASRNHFHCRVNDCRDHHDQAVEPDGLQNVIDEASIDCGN